MNIYFEDSCMKLMRVIKVISMISPFIILLSRFSRSNERYWADALYSRSLVVDPYLRMTIL